MDLTKVDAGGLMDTGLMELSGGGRLVEPLPNGGEGTNDGERTSTLSIHCTMHTGEIQFELQITNTAQLQYTFIQPNTCEHLM